jgi:hypothetical protein
MSLLEPPPSYASATGVKEQKISFWTAFWTIPIQPWEWIGPEFDPELETFDYMNPEEQAAFAKILTSQRVTVSSVKELVLQAKFRYEGYASSATALKLNEIVNALQPAGQPEHLVNLQDQVNSLVVELNTFQAKFNSCKDDGRQANCSCPVDSFNNWVYCRFVQEDEISRVKSYIANINTNMKQLENQITRLKAQTAVDLGSDQNADGRGPLLKLAQRCDTVVASCDKLLM